MSQTPLPDIKRDSDLRRFREYVTAVIAGVVVVGTLLLLVVAALNASASSIDQFTRLKDLLLLVNPLVGVVIGYYFNKTSTEARAENAEATARSASTAAQQAVQERYEVKAQEQQIKLGLNDLIKATEQYKTANSIASPGVLGGNQTLGNKQILDDARAQLDAALIRAKSLAA